METRQLTCAEIDRDDLGERYLAGRLSEPDAESFEAHYFECERCWSAVSRALEVRAAEASVEPFSTVAPAPRTDARVPRSRNDLAVAVPSSGRPERRRVAAPLRWGALAAAASLLLAVSLWRPSGEPDARAPAPVRGVTDTLHVVAGVANGELEATWRPARDAERYRARLLTSNARLLLERETADTTVSVRIDALGAEATDTVYWDVHALDRLLRVTARSGLVAVRLPPRP